MSSVLYELNHGWPSMGLLYGIGLVAYAAGLRRGRAPFGYFVWSPLLVILVIGLSCVIYSLVVQPLAHTLGVPRNDLGDVLTALPSYALLAYAWGRLLAIPRKAQDTYYRRGAIVRAGRPGKSHGGAPRSGITLAGIPVPPQDEPKHFKIIGATGTGKSTAIRELLSGALARGDRAIIADPDGGYLDIFYDASRGDVILNPFEPGARKWDLFGEVIHLHDVEQLARSLIPDMGGEERVWSEYARTFLSAVAQQLVRVSVKDDRTLYRLIRSAPVGELRKLLAGTSAGPFLDDGSEKMFGSLRSVASSAVRALEYITEQQAQPFSVRQWVREGGARRAGGEGGVLFLPYRASQIAALRSVISAWMRLGIFEAMDRPPGDQRLWFVVDELDALGAIDGLKDALARLRKFGGRCVLGFQSIAQVSGTYGVETAATLVENCGNTLILRCSASERGGTSEFASKVIGQREVVQITESRSRNADRLLPTITTAQHVKIEPAVMASEIERLPDLSGFLRLASNPDWQRVSLTPVDYPIVKRDTPAVAPGSTAARAVVPTPASALLDVEAPNSDSAKPIARAPSRKRAPAPRGARKRPIQAPAPVTDPPGGVASEAGSSVPRAASEGQLEPPASVTGPTGRAELDG